jgi:hypothetical protein
MKRMTFTAAAALLALTALQGRAVADSPAPGAPGATSPATWQPRGAAIPGAATTADAPAMKPSVTYRDTIKPGQTKMYGIALDARSSAYASAFALPPAGSRVAYGDGIELKLQSADGTNCDSQEAHFGDDGDARPVGTAVVRTIGGLYDNCQGANQYTLQVHRTSGGTSDPGPWPLELRYVSEPGLKSGGTALPAPAPAFGSASPTPLTTGTARQAAGGPGIETAAAVRTGIWKDRVLPGETRFYKIPVDWGQQATVFADFSSAQVTDGSAFTIAGVRLSAYSPVRQYIDGTDGSYQGTPTSLVEQLAPVAYANRTSPDEDVQAVRYAGWYYFAVTVHPDVAKAVKGAVSVTLRVQVKGAALAAPAYDGDPGKAGIGIDAHDVSSANGAAPGGGSPSSGLRVLAFAAFGVGTVLLLTLAAWFAAARRRVARAVGTADAAPRQSGYGPPQGW